MNQKERLVIIGNGMAGARLVEDILARRGGERYEIVVFGDEPYGNYNRILLSSVLAGSHNPKDIFINPLSWYEKNRVTLHAGVPVEQIDRERQLVTGRGGVVEAYDKLVFATGSTPFIPPIEGLRTADGDFKPGVFVFRTLDDCDRILKYAGKAHSAAVIGGGLLGLEAARGLHNQHLTVHVVHLMPYLMEMQLDPPAGAILKGVLERLGVRIHLEKATSGVLGDSRVTGLAFQDGSQINCDLVVVSAGIRPNAELARAAGIAVERGIIVGDGLASPTDSAVFAVGECAQHRGKIYGLVAPLWEQTRILADRLTGWDSAAAYQGSRVSTKLKVMGVQLAVMGEKDLSDPADEVVTYAEPARGIYKKLIVRDGRLTGAILLGDGMATAGLVQTFDRDDPLPENRAELLFPPALAGQSVEVADLPDSAQICNCNGVTKGTIVAAVRGGHRSLSTVCAKTRAGTGCGSCKPDVQTLLELAAGGAMTEDPSIHYYVPGIPLSKPDLIRAIREHGLRSVSALFDTLAGGREDPGSKPGLASLLKTIWGADYIDERDARFINDRVHANIQRDGTFSVVPRIYGGVTSPEQLRRIADVAEKYDVPMVKITGGQRIDLLGVSKENLPSVWRDLGMPSGHAYTKAFRTCKTCVGSEFCRFGLSDSTDLGIRIEERFQGLEAPHKLKLATAGCPRNCSEATTKDVGAIAIEGGRWEIYVGGAAGSRVRKGDLLTVVDTPETALQLIGRFLQYYRIHAKYLERTYDFVERVGIEILRQELVEDVNGLGAQLDADVGAAVSGFSDPWLEADFPNHPRQFAGPERGAIATEPAPASTVVTRPGGTH